MEIEEALFSYLSTNASVTYLAGDHGYPMVIPQDVELKAEPGLRSAWAYQRVSGAETMDHDLSHHSYGSRLT